ncbi:hypothetical protein DPMN_175658 [Dreissena polymorpha]|uniref:Uncharacterized protein n=1 Tax=Dreissena polymorpha TaxID=45954 RepID=A0A9D4E8A1_DREPO|nr:hypothetical protein DPMN_175658 [Dreissena polymorpha]
MNIKSLDDRCKAFRTKDKESFSQTLSLLLQLDKLSIDVEYDNPDLWQSLHGLNIKSLSLSCPSEVKHTESLSQSLSSLTQLERLSIEVWYDFPGLWEALHGLSIKNLSMRLLEVKNQNESLSRAL